MLLLLALLQSGPPTVGDTVWVTRTVRVPPGREVRAADWELGDGDVELLGPPQVRRSGDEAYIAYPVVVWRPGAHPLAVPGPLLLAADGQADTLPAQPLTITVASILPQVPPDSVLPVQPRADIVARRETSPVPLLALWGVALAVLAPAHVLWRRRGAAPAGAAPAAPPPAPVEVWADAGEYRAVIAGAATRVRAAMARGAPEAHRGLDTEAALAAATARRPDWPAGELADLLRALDEARFSEAPFPDALGLDRDATEMARRLDPSGVPA